MGSSPTLGTKIKKRLTCVVQCFIVGVIALYLGFIMTGLIEPLGVGTSGED